MGDADRIRPALEAWLRLQRGDGVSITELRRIATGNSRAMWFVATDAGDRYVARVEQGGVFGTSGAAEFELMRAAAELGCAVAPVRWSEPTGSVIGRPFFVMDFVEGVTTGRDDRSMSPQLATDFVRQLHRLHTTGDNADRVGAVRPGDATAAQIDRWHQVYRSTGRVVPLLEEGAAWLHHHAPPLERLAIVHGDPGPGNLVHDGDCVLALTDWEFAHLGDPDEDWAYLVAMRGARTMPRERWLALFDDAAGVTIEPSRLHYWTVFNFFKGACANATCRDVFAAGNPAPNMAIIGTALHQTYVRQVAALIAPSE